MVYQPVKDYKVASMHVADVIERFAPFRHRFSLKQWQVVAMYYGEGLTQDAIAQRIGCGRSAVSARLSRIRRMMDRIGIEMRREAIDAARRFADSDGLETFDA